MPNSLCFSGSLVRPLALYLLVSASFVLNLSDHSLASHFPTQGLFTPSESYSSFLWIHFLFKTYFWLLRLVHFALSLFSSFFSAGCLRSGLHYRGLMHAHGHVQTCRKFPGVHPALRHCAVFRYLPHSQIFGHVVARLSWPPCRSGDRF